MDLERVESTNIAAIGYDAEAQALVVEFRAGTRYRYSQVPPEVYEGLRAAPSKGRYLAQRLVRNAAYPCEKLPHAPPPSPSAEAPGD